jgi:hypothetical protein
MFWPSVRAPQYRMLSVIVRLRTKGHGVLFCLFMWTSRWNEWKLRMASAGMLRRVALVRIDVSEKISASIIRVTRIGEVGTTLAVTS